MMRIMFGISYVESTKINYTLSGLEAFVKNQDLGLHPRLKNYALSELRMNSF
jgi:hypothetical protein